MLPKKATSVCPRKIGVTICEDAWNDEDFWQDRRYRINPIAELANEGAELVRHLAEEVVQSMEIATRSGLGGGTLIIVGSRSETVAFPYGFFKDWTLDAKTARFYRH